MRRQPSAIVQLVSRPPSQRRIGPFILVEQLGQGGFAPVWAARETYEDQNVRDAAVKLFALGRQSHAARERLIREAQALCRVDHPNVVRFYSLVLDEPSRVGALAMELVKGQSLGYHIRESGPLPPAKVLHVGLAVGRALAEVHRVGLFHRDVKPDNVMEADGTYKLIDFGVALPSDDDEHDRLTADPGETTKIAQRATGTPGFVAPEYMNDQPPSVAGDLYALGATLHVCLLGYPPAAKTNEFPWDLDPEILEGRRPAPPLNARAPYAPAPLVELIERLVLPNPEARPRAASWVVERIEAMMQSAPRTRSLPPEDIGPFRGLGRFEADDRDVFFGRDGEIGSVLELLRRRHFVVLVGPSGSGKSSLARAGVLPRVTEGALERWPKKWDTVIVAPGSDPQTALLRSLSVWLGHAVDAHVDDLVASLDDCVQETGRGLLLCIDPLEELVTLDPQMSLASKQFFIDVLVRLSDAAPEGIKWLGTARRDLLDALLALPNLGKTIARSLVVVEPLTPSALRDVLLQALDAYGYTLEDEALADELLVGVEAASEAMPLVAFALMEAWRARDTEGKRLTRAGLMAMGGVRGALEKHAEATFATFSQEDTDKRAATRRMFLALTTLEGTRATRSLEQLQRVGGDVALAFVKTFVEARLCAPVEGGLTLAHEALIVQWPRLAGWLKEAYPSRLVVAELERAARFWKTDPELAPLLNSTRLERIKRATQAADGEWLSDDAQAYVATSTRAARRRRWWTALGFAGTALVTFLGILIQGRETNSPPRTDPVERQLHSSIREQPSVAKARTTEPVVTSAASAITKQVEAERSMRAKTIESTKRMPAKSAAPRTSANVAPEAIAVEKPVESTMNTPDAIPQQAAPTPSASTKRKKHWVIKPERTIR